MDNDNTETTTIEKGERTLQYVDIDVGGGS